MNYKRIKKREGLAFCHSFLKIVKIIIVFWLIGIGNMYSKTDESQQNPIVVSGIIKDNAGEPMVGVTVSVAGRSDVGTATDMNGRYQITVPADGSLSISYIGYKKEVIPVRNRTSIDVVLEEDAQLIDEVVVIGYGGTQGKKTLSGSVSSIKNTELVKVKNENIQNMLTGKVPGVRVWQRSSEPGAFDTRFDIRGYSNGGGSAPLIVIDGIPRTMEEFQRLSPNDVEDISILKDGSAAIYGMRSANGVVLVTTKKGTKRDKTEISYSGSYTMQFPSGMPKTTDAFEYMTARNWGRQRNLSWPQTPIYAEDEFEEYQNGNRKSWDWYEYMFKKIVPETQHNVSITGGNDRTQYYVGAGYFYQNSIFSTNDRDYSKYNLVSNMSTKIYDNLTFDLSLSAIIDQRNNPNESAVWTIRDYWRMNPLYLNGPYADIEETMFNANVTERENPFTMLYSDNIGWEKRDKRWFDGIASLKYDLPWIKGMSLKGMFGYNVNVENFKRVQKKFVQYQYDATNKVYNPSVYPRSNVPRVLDEQLLKTQILSQFVLNYNTVVDRNTIGAMLAWESQWRKGENFYAQKDLAFLVPYQSGGMTLNQAAGMNINQDQFYIKNQNSLAGRFNYSFADKYLAELVFRYDGSSMFAPGHQWGFFPGGSLGWRVSEEEFFKSSSLDFIQQLKLRASYASTGDDSAARYQFMTGYNYPTGGIDVWSNREAGANNQREYSGGYVFGGNFINSVDNRGIPNPDVTWFTANVMNLAIDFEAWKGLFGFTFEYFNRERDGLLATRAGGIPTVIGAALPQENINKDKHYGLELELTHRRQLGDFSYKTAFTGTVARRKIIFREERSYNNSRDRWWNSEIDRLQGKWRGFEFAGQFQNWDEIWNSPLFNGRGTLPGDYIFVDWNGDGEINDLDQHYLRFNQDTPLMTYSWNFSSTYKRFDFSFLFQGSAGSSLEYGEIMRDPQETLKLRMDQWHPINLLDDPYDPTTQWTKGYYSFNASGNRNNGTLNVENASYIRLKNIELGYNLPDMKTFSARVYVSGYNVFTLTKVRNTDPEHPGINDSWGFMYPLNKTLTFGLTVKF